MEKQKVYVWLLMLSVDNGVDNWTSVQDVYFNADAAELKSIELNGVGKNPRCQYYIQRWKVNQDVS